MTAGGAAVLGGTGTVGSAMLLSPKVWAADLTVAEARTVFENDHVHSVLVVAAGKLAAVVDRRDLTAMPDHAPAVLAGRLVGRTTGAWADLEDTRLSMIGEGRRRLAVTDRTGTLLGLLCLKRSYRGFCADGDVAARAAEREAAAEVG